MNDVMEKIVISLASAVFASVMTYGMKAVSLEGRLDGIERAVIRIEQKLSAK